MVNNEVQFKWEVHRKTGQPIVNYFVFTRLFCSNLSFFWKITIPSRVWFFFLHFLFH